MKGGVVCVGRLYADLVFTGAPSLPQAGTETFAQGLSIHAGGGAAITAAYLSALGRPASLVAYRPGAPFDDAVAEQLREHGIDAAHVVAEPGRTEPQVTVAIATGGDRAFLTRAPGRPAPAADLAALRRAGAVHLHVGELRTLLDMPGLLARARAVGLTVSVDCGSDPAFGPEAAEAIRAVDLFMPNADEVALLAASGIDAAIAPRVVIKRGRDGARLVERGRSVDRPAWSATVVDTTGAGDAFDGGFLDAWLDGAPPDACLDRGHVCGARAVTAAGGLAGALALRAEGAGRAAAG